jgi:hypothetical protein
VSRQVELPDPVYAALEEVAAAAGTTPAEWIAARVTPALAAEPECEGQPPRTLADEFASHVGGFRSGRSDLSERVSEIYGEIVMEKHRARQLRAPQGAAVGSSIDLPDPVRVALEDAASASGTTPAGWIAAHLPPGPAAGQDCDGSRPRTLAERFEGYLGFVDTGEVDLAVRHSELFADGMEEKQRTGRL